MSAGETMSAAAWGVPVGGALVGAAVGGGVSSSPSKAPAVVGGAILGALGGAALVALLRGPQSATAAPSVPVADPAAPGARYAAVALPRAEAAALEALALTRSEWEALPDTEKRARVTSVLVERGWTVVAAGDAVATWVTPELLAQAGYEVLGPSAWDLA